MHLKERSNKMEELNHISHMTVLGGKKSQSTSSHSCEHVDLFSPHFLNITESFCLY